MTMRCLAAIIFLCTTACTSQVEADHKQPRLVLFESCVGDNNGPSIMQAYKMARLQGEALQKWAHSLIPAFSIDPVVVLDYQGAVCYVTEPVYF